MWFGIPELPSRPEFHQTSPLVMAVRLGRLKCVEALLRLSASINVPDGFGLTPLQYTMFLLLKCVGLVQALANKCSGLW